ncbi:alpha/beta hydrolase [Streptococcus caviae]|uniref:alpha/beta hydrolase n=1 Tax=Streptococcus sp. 'caviae' TaxID=1915004 RepID=UPI00094B7A8D|nr:alpha/beta hydrolase [Streptococcus sp. 'caviae']OLN82676.1 alpha/beta hydrolase [Streptococcus sp. 'caviae']
MKKKQLLIGLMAALAGILALFAYQSLAHPLNKADYIQSRTPTIFFHGYGSSARAETHMVNAAKNAGVTKTVIRANVDRKGQVALVGKIPENAINPIVKVNFADNRNTDYAADGRYTKAVVSKLQAVYHFKKMNMVGHSMGNMAIHFYLLANAQNAKLPQLQKQVDIAGHFNGIKGYELPEGLTVDSKTGRPNKMTAAYKRLLKLRNCYPKNQVDVLNLYGDIGDGSDGLVTNESSRTLKYLIVDRAKSYKEHRFSGKLASHSKLHENPQLDKVLIRFLWGK